MFAKSAS